MTFAICFAVIGVAGVIGAVVGYSSYANNQCKKIENNEIAEKEKKLLKKLGKAQDEKIEEPVTNDVTEEVKQDVKDEVKEEVKEEVVQETTATTDNVVEEKTEEEKVEDVKEETIEEIVEEPKEEQKEEPVVEVVEEVKEEVKEEPKKEAEIKAEPVIKENEDDFSKEVRELLKDIPYARSNTFVEKKNVANEAPIEEKPAEEKVAVKPAPVKKAAKKVEPKAPLPRKAPAKKATQTKQMADGKWTLIADKEGYYFGELRANNGQLILTTEKYKGVSGIKSGIETIKKNLLKDNYEISVDKNSTANFKLFGSNAALLCIGEGYTSKDSAESAINSVKNFINSPFVVSEELDEIENKKYKIAAREKNDGGKWVIVDTKDSYVHAELKANNGQVLLVTENYKGTNSLNSGLETIIKNISTGNFAVKRDKNDNYNFKIFSENKRLLALGAGYSSLTNCESAIISVMKFCSSPIVEED